MNEVLCPAVRVSGRASPLIVNSEVLMLALDSVMLDPLALSEAVKLLLCPTVTVPKLSVAGLTANWPETVAVPARVIVTFASDASETTKIDPLKFPPEVGLNVEAKVELCPGFRVSGSVKPVMPKPVPETLA